MAGDLNVKLG